MPDHTSLAGFPDRLHAIESGVSALRRGMPAFVGTTSPMAMLAVETADDVGLEALHALAPQGAILLLARSRADTIGADTVPPGRIVALATSGLGLADLRALADPTYPQRSVELHWVDVPAGAEAALGLAVLARVLPALLVVPSPGRVGIPERDVFAHAALSASALVRVSEAAVPLEDVADARLVAFRAPSTGSEHYAVLIGRPEDAAEPLVRVHSECFTGDLLGSLRCDCGPQLRSAIRRIAADGAGAVLYLAQEGRGIGLPNKLRAYTLQDRGLDTLDANLALGFAADEREFLTAAAMLRQLGLHRVRLLTNNPDKLATLAANGIEVAGRASLFFAGNGVNDRYLETKAQRFGHLPG